MEDFNIHFHNLFAITNLPISRFLDYLIASENYEDYMYALVDAYNPTAVANVMCTKPLFGLFQNAEDRQILPDRQ